MNIKLSNYNYLIIPNFINYHRAKDLAKEFSDHCKSENIPGDSQAPNSNSDYNYISFLELLCEKTHQVSSILEETVLPTYCYSRVYYNGSILERHTDRDACEISLTLHLDGDKPWPIYIETPNGEEKSVILNPGDAMMYLGKVAEHWRNQYEGEHYTQVFLHYVRSRGNCAYAYFDKKTTDEDKKITSIKNINSEESPNEIQKNEEKDVFLNQKSIELIIPKPENTLEQYIEVVNDIISPEICDRILEEYANSGEWTDSCVGDKTNPLQKTIRNCTEIGLSSDFVLSKNYKIRKELDNEIFNSVKNAIQFYTNKHKEFTIDIDTGYNLLKYDEGNFYIEHTDSFKEQQRSLSCSLQLNHDYDGGEFAFFNRQMMVKSKKGSAIMFPSNFMFPHEIMPVIKGTRYSIITWLV